MKTFLDTKEVSKNVGFARELAKYLRTQNMAGTLRKAKQKMAQLPAETRWSGVFIMLDQNLQLKQFCVDNVAFYPELELTKTKWKKFQQIRDVLEPFKLLTDLLQRQSLRVPDFLESWFKIQAKLRQMSRQNPFCKRMIRAVESRESKIFDSIIISNHNNFDVSR